VSPAEFADAVRDRLAALDAVRKQHGLHDREAKRKAADEAFVTAVTGAAGLPAAAAEGFAVFVRRQLAVRDKARGPQGHSSCQPAAREAADEAFTSSLLAGVAWALATAPSRPARPAGTGKRVT
jgi:hypothetical protein